jgi:hypothetical protein
MIESLFRSTQLLLASVLQQHPPKGQLQLLQVAAPQHFPPLLLSCSSIGIPVDSFFANRLNSAHPALTFKAVEYQAVILSLRVLSAL